MDDITLPEGVNREDVKVESEVEAIDQTSDDQYSWKPFNPQNGRYYETNDPGCADHDNTTVTGGLQVNCAYEDCSGHTTVIVSDDIRDNCPECGEGKMGREQFDLEAEKHENKYVPVPRVDVPSGSEIKNCRLDLELTQSEVAKHGDVSAATVSLAENNKATPSAVQKVCRALSDYKLRNR